MLGQNDNDQEEQVSQSLSDSSAGQQLPKSQADIYVMPEKFHPGKKNSSDNKMLMIAISVFLLVLVVVGGYFGYEQYKSANSQKVAVDQNPVVTQSDVTNQEPAIVTSTDTSLPEVTSTEASTTVTSTDSGLATTTATSTGNVVVDANMPPATTADADNDGLTDSEEGVIGARFDNPDSDGDSHPDGTEITNGYDPLSKGRLVDASFVQKITSNFSSDNFQTLSIKGWNFNNIFL